MAKPNTQKSLVRHFRFPNSSLQQNEFFGFSSRWSRPEHFPQLQSNNLIQYSDIHITLYHKGASIGTRPVIPGFYQSHKKSVSCSVLVNAGGQFWRGIGNGNIVVLRAGLETGVRYRILRWKTEKHRMDFEAFVIIDGQGRIDGGKNISLHRIPSWQKSVKIKGFFSFSLILIWLSFFLLPAESEYQEFQCWKIEELSFKTTRSV